MILNICYGSRWRSEGQGQGQPHQAPVVRRCQKGAKKDENRLWAPKILATLLFTQVAKFSRYTPLTVLQRKLRSRHV